MRFLISRAQHIAGSNPAGGTILFAMKKWHILSFFKELSKQLILSLIERDPCRRCIVRACCSQICYLRERYNKLFGHSPFLQRATALSIISSVIIILISLYTIIVKE